MSDTRYIPCVICKKQFVPLHKEEENVCTACIPIVLQNKNKTVPCEPIGVKQVNFKDGSSVGTTHPLFRGQKDLKNVIPGTSNIAPRNLQGTADLAQHIAGTNNMGSKDTPFISFTKN